MACRPLSEQVEGFQASRLPAETPHSAKSQRTLKGRRDDRSTNNRTSEVQSLFFPSRLSLRALLCPSQSLSPLASFHTHVLLGYCLWPWPLGTWRHKGRRSKDHNSRDTTASLHPVTYGAWSLLPRATRKIFGYHRTSICFRGGWAPVQRSS